MVKTSIGFDENIEATLCYIFGWISGLGLFFLEDKNRFVRFHAVQSIFTFFPMMILWWFFTHIPIIGLPFSWLIFFLTVFVWMMLVLKTYAGENIKLPLIGDIVDIFISYLDEEKEAKPKKDTEINEESEIDSNIELEKVFFNYYDKNLSNTINTRPPKIQKKYAVEYVNTIKNKTKDNNTLRIEQVSNIGSWKGSLRRIIRRTRENRHYENSDYKLIELDSEIDSEGHNVLFYTLIYDNVYLKRAFFVKLIQKNNFSSYEIWEILGNFDTLNEGVNLCRLVLSRYKEGGKSALNQISNEEVNNQSNKIDYNFYDDFEEINDSKQILAENKFDSTTYMKNQNIDLDNIDEKSKVRNIDNKIIKKKNNHLRKNKLLIRKSISTAKKGDIWACPNCAARMRKVKDFPQSIHVCPECGSTSSGMLKDFSAHRVCPNCNQFLDMNGECQYCGYDLGRDFD